MTKQEDSWEVQQQKQQQKPKAQRARRGARNVQNLLDDKSQKSQNQDAQVRNQTTLKNQDSQKEIEPDKDWINIRSQANKEDKFVKQGNKRGKRGDRNQYQDYEASVTGNRRNSENRNQDRNQEAPTIGNCNKNWNRNQEKNQQNRRNRGNENRGNYGDKNNYGDRRGFNRGYDNEHDFNAREYKKNHTKQGQNRRGNRGNQDYNNNEQNQGQTRSNRGNRDYNHNRDYNRGRQDNNGEKNQDRERNGREQRRGNGQRPQRNETDYNRNRQGNQIFTSSTKTQNHKKKSQILDIVPQGQYSWSELGISIYEVVLSFRKILEFKADIIMIPYNKIKLEIYPGAIINKCKVDYSKIIQSKEGINQVGSVYLKKCTEISNFNCFAFVRVGKQQEKQIKLQSIKLGINQLLKCINKLKVSVESLIIPYSAQLGDAFDYLSAILHSITNTIIKVKHVYVVPRTTEDFLNIAAGMKTVIKQIIENNELTIV